jgi:hypothetical protein
VSNASFWSCNTPAFSRRYSLLSKQKEENDEDEGFRSSSSSLLFFLNSFFVLRGVLTARILTFFAVSLLFANLAGKLLVLSILQNNVRWNPDISRGQSERLGF